MNTDSIWTIDESQPMQYLEESYLPAGRIRGWSHESLHDSTVEQQHHRKKPQLDRQYHVYLPARRYLRYDLILMTC